MDLNIKETKFGDIIIWNKVSKKFIAVRNYYKLPNLLKTSEYEMCCMSLGNGSFVSLTEPKWYYTWYEAMKVAEVYKGSEPIKSYLPNIDELLSFYPLINEFNSKIEKLRSLGFECNRIKIAHYWSSTEFSSTLACFLNTCYGDVYNLYKNFSNCARVFVAFKTF